MIYDIGYIARWTSLVYRLTFICIVGELMPFGTEHKCPSCQLFPKASHHSRRTLRLPLTTAKSTLLKCRRHGNMSPLAAGGHGDRRRPLPSGGRVATPRPRSRLRLLSPPAADLWRVLWPARCLSWPPDLPYVKQSLWPVHSLSWTSDLPRSLSGPSDLPYCLSWPPDLPAFWSDPLICGCPLFEMTLWLALGCLSWMRSPLPGS